MAKKKTVARFMAVFAAIMIFSSSNITAASEELIVAGTPIGVKFSTDGVVITGIRPINDAGDSPALDAGLKRGDVITEVDGKRVSDAAQLGEAIALFDGEQVEVGFIRAGKPMKTTVTPARDEDGRRILGLWIRDSASGIGTLTFIDPKDLTFAALGHGICDAESGALLPIKNGSVEEVTLTGITEGKAGNAGELHGFFSGSRRGTLTDNSLSGVRGKLDKIPTGLENEIYPVGTKNDVSEGKAYIFTTVDGGGRQMYEIEISKISPDSEQKNFTVRITDKELLKKTGGIVQGMSGSPIIQNGKLIGAVTHVLISDPTCGYGILIENMLGEQTARISSDIAA
ncbi:MAG: SpoIVB peptidase [Clostridia bacterium]|nr:SpoIVB peptidase [Clostridia bacterium]